MDPPISYYLGNWFKAENKEDSQMLLNICRCLQAARKQTHSCVTINLLVCKTPLK